MSQFDQSPESSKNFYGLLEETASVISSMLKALERGHEEKDSVYKPWSAAEARDMLDAIIDVLAERIGYYEQLSDLENRRKVARKIEELRKISPELGSEEVPPGFLQKVRRIIENKQ